MIPPEINRTDKIKSSILKAHASTLPNIHDEDRFCLYEYDSNHFCFCVFDGHGGDFGSKLCSRNLARLIYTDIDENLDILQTVFPDVRIDGDTYDALLCEAINNVITEMNRKIKKESGSGTTFSGLFIRIADDGSCHAVCANVGDSRIIVHYNKMTAAMTEDHNLQSDREKKRIEDHATPIWNMLPTLLVFPLISNQKQSKLDNIHPSMQRLAYSKDLIDYLENIKEGKLEEQRHDLVSLLQCMEAQPNQNGSNYNNNDHDTAKPKTKTKIVNFDLATPRRSDDVSNSSKLTQVYSMDAPVTPSSSALSKDLAYTPKSPSLDGDDEFVTMNPKLGRKKSILERRVNKSGEAVGPVTLTSRSGVSIMMTRSIGDRNAARTCVCVPDFTKMVIPKGESARFMLGTDGMWDVMSNDKAMKHSLDKKHDNDLTRATKAVVHRARVLREEAPMRIDDITCIIVDINKSSLLSPSSSHSSIPSLPPINAFGSSFKTALDDLQHRFAGNRIFFRSSDSNTSR